MDYIYDNFVEYFFKFVLFFVYFKIRGCWLVVWIKDVRIMIGFCIEKYVKELWYFIL